MVLYKNIWIITVLQICSLYHDNNVVCYDCENPDLPTENGLYVIPNIKVTSRNEDHALLTTPPGFAVRKSSLPNAGLGAFAETTIPKGTRLGPYDGLMYSLKCDNCNKAYTWAVRYENSDYIKYYVDAASKAHSSWIRYINCANTVDQENLYFYQYNYEIYYVTYECIKPGTELMVWYGKNYGKLLRLNRTTEDYMRRFNETDRRTITESSLSYGPIKKILSNCYRFVNQSPGPVKSYNKLCRHWKAYVICRYFICDVNPCTGLRDCAKCRGLCFHAGNYYKPNQELLGGDHVNKLHCRDDGEMEFEFTPSTFMDMCFH